MLLEMWTPAGENATRAGDGEHLPRKAAVAESSDQLTPSDLKLDLKAQTLVIDWKDGRRSTFDLGRLRRACPCATCRRERDAPPSTSLPILNIPPGVDKIEVVDAELMGHYAVNLKWSDGHNTGIFDYKYLRSLDETESQ
jgi:DUF971 family protein